MPNAVALALLGASCAAATQHHTPALRAGGAALVALGGPERRQASTPHFGDTRCPCIGFDHIEGETVIKFEDKTEASYPADLGARCEAWDNGRHPSCKEGEEPGIGNDWCGQQWCYVDSCTCELPVLPKASIYVTDAKYRGRPIFYSYATCGGKDTWADERPKVGEASCQCIGFDNVKGTTEILVKAPSGEMQMAAYPADIGATCQAWDQGRHPECARGKDSPKWCKERWCYVDPCACNLEEKPKVTMYLPESTFTGKSLYYSYETCGSKDSFTEKYNTHACFNQKTEEKCLSLKVRGGGLKCAWTGLKCLGWELLEHPLCKTTVKPYLPPKSSAPGRSPAMVVAFAALAGRFAM